MKRISNVAVFGMGAFGSSLAKQISENTDTAVYGVVHELDAFWGSPILIDDQPVRVNYRDLETMPSAMDLIILCVKSYDFRTAAEAIRPMICSDTVILSFTGGLDRSELLLGMYGTEHVVRSTVIGADVVRNGRYVSVLSRGTVCFGNSGETNDENLDRLEEFFLRCGIKYTRSEHIDYLIWKEFMFAAACGQISLVFQLRYGEIFSNERAVEVMREVQQEIVKVSQKYGIGLTERDIRQWEEFIHQLPADGQAHMLQDFRLNRRLETDVFCDYFCNLAKDLHVAIPACNWLREEIHSMILRRGSLRADDGEIRGLSTRKSIYATPEKIASQLRVDIMQGKYPSGELIAENELARRFDASRSSVRAALQMLANESLLTTLPNGRREVTAFSSKRVNDLFEMRWDLENMALTRIIQNNDTVYPSLADILGKMEKKYRSHSITEEPADLDVMFHRELIRCADNIFLTNAWENIAQLWYTTMQFDSQMRRGNHYLMEMYGKHRHLYEMILSRDRAVFPELKRHIQEENGVITALVSSFGR